MLACEVLTRKSKLDYFPGTFSLAASCSLMALLDFLPFLESGSYSSAEVYVVSFELAFALDLVTDPSEFTAASFLSLDCTIPSS